MESLMAYFESIGFSKQDCHTIGSLFHKKYFEKGDYFVVEGKKSAQIGFIETGQFQYYTITEKGEERTTYISLPNSFMASLLPYLTDTAARENIRAISKAEVWLINKTDVLALQELFPAFKNFYISLLEWQICCIDKAKFDLITLTAEERYAKLLTEEPELLLQIPLQYIASMLGITPRHLSRLRSNS